MKAQIIRRFGEPEVFEATTLPDPAPRPGEVLIRVRASSVNPVDYKIRQNGPAFAPELPAVLHGDVAGVVEAVGEGVSAFSVGDEVWGCAGGVRPQVGSERLDGALAELMRADAHLLARRPANLSWAESGALPLVGVTAYEGLFDRAGLRAGERVLVQGGTGGVGHVVVQLAAAAGAEVTAVVSSPEKAELARSLGATHTIDRKAEDVVEAARRLTGGQGYPLVYDTAGGDSLRVALEAAATSGRVVAISARGEQDLGPMHNKGLSLHVVFMLLPMLTGEGRPRQGQIMAELTRLAEAGKLRPHLNGESLPFARVADAHRRAESGEGDGKVALEGWS